MSLDLADATRATRWILVDHWAFTLIGLLAWGFLAAPRVTHCCGESKADVAKVRVFKLAYEAFPLWARDHADRACPYTVFELDPYTDADGLRDPWGHICTMQCTAGRLVITSRGEDEALGTADDIRSDI